MKRFLLNTLIFIVITATCLAILGLIICSTRSQSFRLPNNENIVFLGNSHIECAVNDSIVKNSFNFARSNDYTEQIYIKLKLLKRYNSQIDTVIIGYDNVLLSQDLDKPVLGIISPYYYDQYTINDITEIIKQSSFKYVSSHFYEPFDSIKVGNVLPSLWGEKININNINNLGGYEYLARDKLQSHIELEQSSQIRNLKFDNLSIYFLDKTLKFCEQYDITPIFLFTPHHKSSKLDIHTYINYYNKNLKHIKYYDFREMELDDSCFGDKNHLNYKGARIFSEYLETEVIHKKNYKNNIIH